MARRPRVRPRRRGGRSDRGDARARATSRRSSPTLTSSPRAERAVTQLVAEGLSTSAIAERLYLSPWTVQDHLKAVSEKVGVTTRGELVARVFFDHRPPAL